MDTFLFLSGLGVFSGGLGVMFYLAGSALAKIGSVPRQNGNS